MTHCLLTPTPAPCPITPIIGSTERTLKAISNLNGDHWSQDPRNKGTAPPPSSSGVTPLHVPCSPTAESSRLRPPTRSSCPSPRPPLPCSSLPHASTPALTHEAPAHLRLSVPDTRAGAAGTRAGAPRSGLEGLGGGRATRTRGTSVYLRRVPGRGRRHRTRGTE